MLFQQETFITCPYCGEAIDVLIDDSSEPQSYYEDCSVCCAPILFVLAEDESGEIQLTVKRDDE
jgi:Cysteine-rich CPXCG